jgi:Rrf2 family protein
MENKFNSFERIREFIMQITRQADYAVRAIIYLAENGTDERASTSKIAQEKQIPPSFLAKIVSQLSVAGLLQTSRGARVVFRWQDPQSRSLLEVVRRLMADLPQ